MKVLLAIDGSSYSNVAIREVGQRPWPPGTEVRVVTVDAPFGGSMLPGVAGNLSAYDDLVRRQRDEAHGHMDMAVSLLRQLAPQLTVSASLLEGSPKELLVTEAGQWGADLIVVGSHGRGAVKSLFYGSVSLAVVFYAPCSVLIVRNPSATDIEKE